LDATLWRDHKKKPDAVAGDAQVWRANDRSVVTRIHLDQMWIGGDRQTYRWKVQTLKTTGPSCKQVCFDHAPNTGAIVEPIPPDLE
jgi:hypothetical protein